MSGVGSQQSIAQAGGQAGKEQLVLFEQISVVDTLKVCSLPAAKV